MLILTLIALVAVHGQYTPPDPFAHSNCTCTDYCGGKCAINTTDGNYKHTQTLYRMTPYVARTLTNKNTGDVKGDTSFVLSRKDISEECLKNPTSSRCFFNGDDPNSTDLVIEFEVDMDGQWGPYEYCNPVHTNDPSSFSCQATYDGGGSMKMNVSCQCDRMNVTVGWENKTRSSGGSLYECYKGNGGAMCYQSTHGTMNKTDCSKTCVPPPTPPPTPAPADAKYYCHYGTCRESHFGKESLKDCQSTCSGGGSGGRGKSMGSWYSHPMNGQCNGTHTVGDGSGCTWRTAAVKNVINASCLYNHFDTTIENYNGSYCFKQCPEPTNATSYCYRQCYSKVSSEMTDDESIVPWTKAFMSQDTAAGGCPTVKVPELMMGAEQLNPMYTK
jgi:hypothetical protein